LSWKRAAIAFDRPRSRVGRELQPLLRVAQLEVAERGDLAVQVQVQVRLPVVELELGRRAHLLLRARGVLHRRQPDRDLVRSGALDLGLGYAEGVGPLADRVDRVVDRLRRDLRDLRGRPALVDELDAALQVEAEAGGLRQRRARDDHEQREREQRRHDAEHDPVATRIGHELGVSTRSKPPSSS
jgi:hypothetical protein